MGIKFTMMIFFSFCQIVPAQSQKLSDSLVRNKQALTQRIEQIRNTPFDIAQVNLLKDLGYELLEVDSSLSRQLLEEAPWKKFEAERREQHFQLLSLIRYLA